MRIKNLLLDLFYQNETIMKSLLFKTAWNLVKEMKISMSEALKLAWATIKAEATAFVNTSYNGKKSIVFKKGNCQSGTINGLIEMISNYAKPDMSGAALYYDSKTFNND